MKLCVTLNPRFISAACSECGKRPDKPEDRVHCLSGKYFCQDCCPECNPNRKLDLKR